MKICLFSYQFSPSIGGMETFTHNLATYLVSQGEEVIVVTETGSGRVEQDFNFKVVRRATWRQLSKVIASSDIVHMNGFALKVVLLAMFHNKKVIWTHHGYDSICPTGFAWNENEGGSCQFGFRRCTACMVQIGRAKDIPKRFAAVPLRRLVAHQVAWNVNPSQYIAMRQNLPHKLVIPHGIDTNHFVPFASHRKNEDSSFFLFLGRLLRVKGVDVLIKAVKLCSERRYNFKVVVHGEGPDEARLRTMIQSLNMGEQIALKGFIKGAELVSTINHCMALIVPSLWDEVVGIVVLEAMSCGKPVIASNVGGLGETVNGFGWLFERGEAEQLAECMIEAWNKRDQLPEIGRKAREKVVSTNDWSVVGQKYLQLFAREAAR